MYLHDEIYFLFSAIAIKVVIELDILKPWIYFSSVTTVCLISFSCTLWEDCLCLTELQDDFFLSLTDLERYGHQFLTSHHSLHTQEMQPHFNK